MHTMELKEKLRKPTFSSQAIWNMDSEKLDAEKYPEYTIASVVERGTSKDISELVRYYGLDMIKQTILNADQLLPRTIYLAQTLFGIKVTEQQTRHRHHELV